MSFIINISDEWLGQVKKVLAFPSVNKVLLDDNQIKEYCIYPALYKYFLKFPLEVPQSLPIVNEVEIPFPDNWVYGVTDVRVSDVGMNGTQNSDFFAILAYQMQGLNPSSMSSGSYGVKGYNPNGLIQSREIQREAYKTYQNMNTSISYRIYENEKKIKVYCSTTGTLNITWAKWSLNFDDVRHTQKQNVIQLAQARLLSHLADTAGILSDSALEVSINVDALRQRASDLEAEVKEIWDAYQDIILLHNI